MSEHTPGPWSLSELQSRFAAVIEWWRLTLMIALIAVFLFAFVTFALSSRDDPLRALWLAYAAFFLAAIAYMRQGGADRT